MILPRNVIVFVVDSGRMVLMRNDGDATAPDLTVIEHRECPPPPDRDLFSDAPGRSFSSASPACSFYDKGDPHTAAERAFVASAAAAQANHVDEHTPGVVVAADRVSLGYLQDHYPAGVESRLLAEFDKDFTGMPVAAITRSLLEA
jgi:protein required for attachment to host cells